MTDLARSLAAVASDRDAIGAAWAIVGGLAVSARAEPRLTRDVDVVVAVEDDRAAERVIAGSSPICASGGTRS